MKVKMADLPPYQRPREKALISGIESLSDEEVLALILRSGTRSESVLDLSVRILRMVQSLSQLPRLSYFQLMQIPGIKIAKAMELMAVFELSKRVLRSSMMDKNVMNSPELLIHWLKSEVGYKHQEHLMAIYLNTQNQIVSYKTLFVGTLDKSVIHPREIFREAVESSASRLLVIHNHPSGSITPSQADIEVTAVLNEVGQLMGIPLLDHLIVTDSGYCSLRQNMIID